MKTLQGNFDIEVTGVCDCGETAISDFAQSGVYVARMCVHAIALTRRFPSVVESEKMYQKKIFVRPLNMYIQLCIMYLFNFSKGIFLGTFFLYQQHLKIAVFRAFI